MNLGNILYNIPSTKINIFQLESYETFIQSLA